MRSQLVMAAEESVKLKADLTALKTEASNMERKLSAEVSSFYQYMHSIVFCRMFTEAFKDIHIQHL